MTELTDLKLETQLNYHAFCQQVDSLNLKQAQEMLKLLRLEQLKYEKTAQSLIAHNWGIK